MKWLFTRYRRADIDGIRYRPEKLVDCKTQLVPKVRAPHPENHVRRDVRRVVRNPFQPARNQNPLQSLDLPSGVFNHLDQIP